MGLLLSCCCSQIKNLIHMQHPPPQLNHIYSSHPSEIKHSELRVTMRDLTADNKKKSRSQLDTFSFAFYS